MTRDHDPHLADQMQIGALQRAGKRDVDEPSRYGWLVVAVVLCLPCAIAAVVWLTRYFLGASNV